MAHTYLPRVADSTMTAMLEAMGAVLIEGPKAAGKTSSASQFAKTIVRLDTDAKSRELADIEPGILLDQPAPVAIDEWQLVPDIWNLVRHEVDQRQLPGQFILTGSATPLDDPSFRRHSGAGRFGRLRMRPMSLFESQKSSGTVSLNALFDGNFVATQGDNVHLEAIAESIACGGWPSIHGQTYTTSRFWHQGYLDTVVEIEIPSLGFRRDPRSITRLMTAVGKSTGTAVALSTLAKLAGGEEPFATATVKGYLETLDRLMLLEELPAWTPSMRSAAPLRKTPKRYLVDPSLAAHLMGGGPQRLIKELPVLGQLFENLVVRDLFVYSQPLFARMYHWRDSNDHEIDVVIELPDGRWGAFEIKLNPKQIGTAADSLLRFKNKVNVDLAGEPEFLGVIVSDGPAYRRKDGIIIVPITTLGP